MGNKLLLVIGVVIILIIAFIMYRRKESFTNATNKIILYYSPNCGHCKAMFGSWVKFENEINSQKNGVVAEKIDCSTGNCTGVNGFPTIKLFKKDGNVVLFNGERTVEGFRNFVHMNCS